MLSQVSLYLLKKQSGTLKLPLLKLLKLKIKNSFTGFVILTLRPSGRLKDLTMDTKFIKTNNPDYIRLMVYNSGIINLFAIFFSYFFWFSICSIFLFLTILGVINFESFDSLSGIYKALTVLGVTPILFCALTYRFFRFLFYKYVNNWVDKNFDHVDL